MCHVKLVEYSFRLSYSTYTTRNTPLSCCEVRQTVFSIKNSPRNDLVAIMYVAAKVA